MADMRVTRSGDNRVWLANDAGDEFGFEFTSNSVLMTEMIGEPGWATASVPADANARIARAKDAAEIFAREQGWID